MSALGVVGKYPKGWTTCHIWGYDDEQFVGSSEIVRDRRFFSCLGNMVLLPTPLKGFTDAVPLIKRHLRVCAFHLYGWACEHHSVASEAELIRSGHIPDGYPEEWPTAERKVLPPGTGPASEIVFKKAAARKQEISGLFAIFAFEKLSARRGQECLGILESEPRQLSARQDTADLRIRSTASQQCLCATVQEHRGAPEGAERVRGAPSVVSGVILLLIEVPVVLNPLRWRECT